MNATVKPAQTPPCDRELVERAGALVPTLLARAARCEAEGQVPEDTIADFAAAGFFRTLQPASHGGYEMNPLTFYRVLHQLGRGCPSSAWVAMVIGVHNWEVALLGPQVADDLWRADDRVRTSSSYVPFGKAEPVAGGYHLSGRWRFSSGSDHCSWAFLGAWVPTGDGQPPDWRVFLVPRSDYEVVQGTWSVFGLAGTGSKDILVPGAFVPAHRTHSVAETYKMDDPGLQAYTSPHYRYPFGTVFHYAVASVVIGMALGALDQFRAQMAGRVDHFKGQAVTANPMLRRRMAEAEAMVSAAIALQAADMTEMAGLIAAGQPIPPERRAVYVWHAAWAGRQCAEAVTTLFRAVGGRAVDCSNVLQRILRDIQAGANHITMDADSTGVNAGGVLLGDANTLPIL